MENHNFVFAYVPKVACTNWKCIFRHLNGEMDYLDARKAHDRILSGFRFLSDIKNHDKIIEDESVKKYCFVRNPYSRILSAYLDKIKPFAIDGAPSDWNPHFHNIFLAIEKYRRENLPEEKGVNFFVFLNWIHSSGNWHVSNHHWIQQGRILYLDKFHYDFMGRFENIENDANHLLNLIGCDLKFPTQSKIRFPATGATDKLNKFYSHREVQLVQNMFAEDFVLLKYSSNFSDV